MAVARAIQAAVSACIEPSNHPTRQQVLKLAHLAKSSNGALEQIQENLFFRLTHPHQSHIREVEHTLVVIQQCSYVAPLAFVDFFKDRIYAIAALTTFRSNTAPASDVKTVNQKARELFQLLRDDVKLQEERNKAFVTLSPGPVEHNARLPALSPPRMWTPTPGAGGTRDRDAQTQNVGETSSLPTPRSSPVQRLFEVKPDDEERMDHAPEDYRAESSSENETLVEQSVEEIVEEGVLAATANTPTEITADQMDLISSSTFDSYTLQVVVSILLERLLAVTGQRTYHHLTKVLKIIDHCLRQGSPSFIKWFKEHRNLIGTLCTSPAVVAVNTLATSILNRLDEVEDTHEPTPSLLRTHGPPPSPGLYPPTPLSPTSDTSDTDTIPLHEPVKDLTAFITTIDISPFERGGYSSVYKARLSVGASTEIVVKKVLTQGGTRAQLDTSINREIHKWTDLRHPNIASFYGITREDDGSIGLVSPYFKTGNVMDYLKSLDKSKVNVLKIMNDITAGLGYLHGERLIHGDIKGSNVVVDDEGTSKLIDFGISRITGEGGYITSGPGASWAWAAPELVPYDGVAVAKTIFSDIWALAITFVELMTGRPPYGGLRLGGILAKFQHRAYPDRPSLNEECYFYPGDRLWTLLLCCWDYTPEHRPSIVTIQSALEEFV